MSSNGYDEQRKKMGEKEVREIEEIAELKAKWPAHSVPPSLWQELERLEEELEQAKKVVEEK